ncbi:MAG: hypothetical protein HY814_08015 [Candidatus Riflebacteria bacterium]|nr:hypothetical protein [Candidatus Riflebacteria bacterium]
MTPRYGPLLALALAIAVASGVPAQDGASPGLEAGSGLGGSELGQAVEREPGQGTGPSEVRLQDGQGVGSPLPRFQAPAFAPDGSAAVDRIFSRLDPDGDGYLQPSDWNGLVREPSNLPLDLDGDSRISRSEFLHSVLTVAPCQAAVYQLGFVSLLHEGRRGTEGGDPAKGLEQFIQAARNVPECPDGYLGAARCLERLGKLDESAEFLQETLAADANQPDAWLNLALIQDQRGRPDDSAAALRRGLAMLEAAAPLRQGWNSQESTRRWVRELLAATRRHFESRPGGGPMLSELARWEQRVVESRLPADRPHPPSLGLARIAELLDDDRVADALRLTEDLAASSKDWQLRVLAAELLGVMGAPPAAARKLDEAERLGAPKEVLACARLGNLFDQGRRPLALSQLRLLQTMQLETWDAEDVGWQLASHGEWELAFPWFRSASPDQEAEDQRQVLVALCRFSVGDRVSARKTLSAFRQPPAVAAPLLLVASDLASRLALLPEAIVMATEAVRQKPRQASYWLRLAELEQLNGRDSERLAALWQARQRLPPDSPLTLGVEAAIRTAQQRLRAKGGR